MPHLPLAQVVFWVAADSKDAYQGIPAIGKHIRSLLVGFDTLDDIGVFVPDKRGLTNLFMSLGCEVHFTNSC